MKKLLTILLCITMLAGLTACGSSNGSSASTSGTMGSSTENKAGESSDGAESGTDDSYGVINFDEEPYTLHVCYAVLSEAQPDLPMIEEKINEITLEKINCKVELEAISLFSLANQYSLKMSAQEPMDLMILFPGSSYLSEFANNNMLMAVDDYLDEWGGSLKEGIADILPAGQFKGKIYAIPQNSKIRANESGLNLSRVYIDKYGIDVDSIHTLEDVEAMFDTIKAAEPSVICCMPETTSTGIASVLSDEYMDTSLSAYGVTVQEEADGSLKVVPITQNEVLRKAIEKTREWYEKGYISKDVLTDQDGGAQGIQTGKCIVSAANSLGVQSGDNWSECIRLHDELPMVTTSDDQLIMWGVASSCKRPDKAIQFLNLCYETKEITNLTMWGVEDVHYTVLENGAIDTSTNQGWQNFWAMFGNCWDQLVRQAQELDTSDAETPEEYIEALKAWQVVESPAYGFIFDTANVKTEASAVSAVIDEYMLPIYQGTVDPSTAIPEWENKMMSAGLQTIMDEMQSQLDAWLATR